MKINEIKAGMSNVAIQAKVIEVSPTRDVQTRYGPKRVADAILEDDTGQISLSLWEDNINSVSTGDTVNVSGAYVTQFRDKVQLNVPRKAGSIQIVKE